jgi:hypothetical protein
LQTVLLLIEGNEAKRWLPGLATDQAPSPLGDRGVPRAPIEIPENKNATVSRTSKRHPKKRHLMKFPKTTPERFPAAFISIK